MEIKQKITTLILKGLSYDLIIAECMEQQQYLEALTLLKEAVLIYQYIDSLLPQLSHSYFTLELKKVIPHQINILQTTIHKLQNRLKALH